jgi:hypothetical protein
MLTSIKIINKIEFNFLFINFIDENYLVLSADTNCSRQTYSFKIGFVVFRQPENTSF